MKKAFFFFCLMCCITTGYAQEFNCNVTVNTPKLQITDPKVFKSLQTAIREFMNNRKWTDAEYAQEEKISLDIIINIQTERTDISPTSFDGELTIIASRPVYKSGYNSVIFRNLDKNFLFNYGEFEVLDFSENSYTTNLTSVLAFYAYVILGVDGDSFAEMGGDAYLSKAQNILNTVPRTKEVGKGWTLDGGGVTDRTRYWLIENLLNVRVATYRRAMYSYHLLGLDQLTTDETISVGMQNVLKALEGVMKTNNDYPSSMIIQLFADSKRQEIINVFSVADSRLRRQVYDIMVKVDGTHTTDYKVLLN